jgi:hypothetical protein
MAREERWARYGRSGVVLAQRYLTRLFRLAGPRLLIDVARICINVRAEKYSRRGGGGDRDREDAGRQAGEG